MQSRGPSVALALALGIQATTLSGQSAVPVHGPGAPAPCVAVIQDPPQASPVPVAPDKAREPDPYRPITDTEVAELLLLMRQATQTDGRSAPFVVRASRERLRFVREEVTAVLVAIHAREAGKRVGSLAAKSGKATSWVEAGVAKVEACVAGRFEGRGGAAAYRQALAILEKHRPALEALLPAFRRWVPPRWTLPAPEPQ